MQTAARAKAARPFGGGAESTPQQTAGRQSRSASQTSALASSVALVVAVLLAVFVLPQPWGWVAVAAGATLEVAESLFWIWLSKRRRASVGAEALVGAQAVVVSPCRPLGQVRIGGELWRARCDAGAAAGDVVRILALDGLTLVVEH